MQLNLITATGLQRAH